MRYYLDIYVQNSYNSGPEYRRIPTTTTLRQESHLYRLRKIAARSFLVLVSWAVLLPLLAAVAAHDKVSPKVPAEFAAIETPSPSNHIQGFSHISWDPQHDSRPTWSVAFDDLSAENNSIGIFSTALHKLLRVSGLHLELYDYSAAGSAIPTDQAVADLGQLVRASNTPQFNLDMTNVSQVTITGFTCRFFQDRLPVLAISSMRAEASYKNAGIVLGGCVVITAADCTSLEANCVHWDVRGRRFKVEGPCAIARGGIKSPGRDLTFDASLNPIGKAPGIEHPHKGGQR